MNRHGRWLAALAAGLFGLALIAPRAEAATVHVWSEGSSTEPYETWAKAATNIQTAVDYAAVNSIPVVQLTNETYTISAQIVVTNAVTVRGASRTETIVLRGTNAVHRIFYVDHADAVVETLTAQNGHAVNAGSNTGLGGGFYIGTGLVRDCDIFNSRGNHSDHRGIGVYLARPGAVLSNSVVYSSASTGNPQGGGVYIAAGALVTHCVLRNNSGSSGMSGGGAYVDGGTLRWSSVYSNSITHGSGVGVFVANNADSLVEYCEVRDNTTPQNWYGSGVGIRMAGAGTVRNCLVEGNRNLTSSNSNPSRGGGLHISSNSVVENCTVVNNFSLTEGGGIWAGAGATIRNCIISGNSAPASPNANTNAGTYVTCLLPGGAPGTGNVDGSPTFIDAANRDFRLESISLGVNVGTDQPWMAPPAVDLYGDPRIRMGQSDIGAYEAQDEVFFCDFSLTPNFGRPTLTVNFSARVVAGDTAGLTYHWDFEGNESWNEKGTDKQTTSHAYSSVGGYWPVLWVTNSAGESASFTSQVPVVVSGPVIHVSTNGANTPPYTNWFTAATDVLHAVAVADHGVTVLVSNGTYSLPASVVIQRAITLESVNGPAVTKLRCASRSYRVLKLDHADAVVRGLTLENGLASETFGGVVINRRGGGAYILAGTLDDCVMTGGAGTAGAEGGGFYLESGLVTNCVVHGNLMDGQNVRGIGGFVAGGEVVDNVISNNWLRNNVGDNNWGGGLHVAGGTVRTCVFSGNSLGYGRGAGLSIAGGLVDRCIVTNNVTEFGTAGGRGGGVYVEGGTLRNTLVIGNRAARPGSWGGHVGGGIYQTGGLIENCTVVTNRATRADATGGGLYATGGATTNSIFAYNTSQAGALEDDVRVDAPAAIGYSRAPELTPGEDGNIVNDPKFLAPASGDYSLASDSPCINLGVNRDWMVGALDLAGNPRRDGARVDMGAYETLIPPRGTMILLR